MSGWTLAAPTTPAVAPRHGEETVSVAGAEVAPRPALVSLVVAVTESGGPVLAFPAGEHEGLPFGNAAGGPRRRRAHAARWLVACEAAA